MKVHRPEDLHSLFARSFASGDLDALVALYEDDAVLVPEPGKPVRGHAAIRAALAAFLALKGDFRMAAPKVLRADGVAVLFADWTLEATGPDGRRVSLAGQTADIVRRQPGGHWLYAIDSPFGAAGAS
jgi:uncharacterized protein (TIGR02246 family)